MRVGISRTFMLGGLSDPLVLATHDDEPVVVEVETLEQRDESSK